MIRIMAQLYGSESSHAACDEPPAHHLRSEANTKQNPIPVTRQKRKFIQLFH